MWSFCRSFCHFVNRITDERGNGRRPNLVDMCMGWSGFAVDSGSLFISSPLRNRELFGHLLAFLISQRPICTTLGEMTDVDKVMHPQHFGTDPTDIRINSAIRIGIPDDFWLKFWRWRRFALCEASTSQGQSVNCLVVFCPKSWHTAVGLQLYVISSIIVNWRCVPSNDART